ncbi:MAG: amidohydrolase family protein [Anaerolineae bacterium]
MIGNSALAREFWEYGRAESCPIYDMHGHMGYYPAIFFPRAHAPDMLRTMNDVGVRLLVFSHHSALHSPNLANEPSIEAVREFPDRFRAYCLVNPNYPEQLSRDLNVFEDLFPDVYVGFKFLSDYHKVALTDDRYRPAWEYADEHELLVLAHTWGGSQYDGEDVVCEAAKRYPNVKFLLGHSCHGAWDAAVRLANDFPNIYLELTAVFDDRGTIEKFVHGAGSDRMLFGTDLPWFDPHHAVGVLMNAEITDEDRHNICHRNAEKLLGPIVPDLVGTTS